MNGGSLCAKRHDPIKNDFVKNTYKSTIKELRKVGVYVLTPEKARK
jgi:hypothetical protein